MLSMTVDELREELGRYPGHLPVSLEITVVAKTRIGDPVRAVLVREVVLTGPTVQIQAKESNW